MHATVKGTAISHDQRYDKTINCLKRYTKRYSVFVEISAAAAEFCRRIDNLSISIEISVDGSDFCWDYCPEHSVSSLFYNNLRQQFTFY